MNRVCEILGIRYPIFSGGMVWCSGWRLASAVSNEGGLGIIGAGSLHPENLEYHIRQCKIATDKPFAVNIPLMYPEIDKVIDIIINEKVPVVVSSAGSPSKYTSKFKEAGIKIVHVVSSVKFAKKCEEAGVDIVVAEGFEAGGHNGKDETTTMALIPNVRKAISIPLVAAGGIATPSQVLAAMALGAEGVQIGTRFALSKESSASEEFKAHCRGLAEGGTMLSLKALSPTRLIKNDFFKAVEELELRGATVDEFRALLGKGRAKKGIFEGDLVEGELEIGQVATLVEKEETVAEIFVDIISGYRELKNNLVDL